MNREKIKAKFNQLKETVGKLGGKTKKLIIIGAVALLVGAVALALVLNNRPYAVLFTGLNAEEAQQIATKLQEDETDFRFDGNSTILVKEEQLDQIKATLVQEGYPQSGFTYDTFIDNTGMMTTDTDKQTYKLYELQDRIGSTIRLFDGVADAKVTIALGEESKYALNDEKQASSATAVVTMENGGSPTEDQAAAIQRLVAKSIPDMELEDVAVFDGNGNDVSVDSGAAATSSDAEEIAQVVENQIVNNVMQVLSPIYGKDNVRVSARAKVNMEQLIRETITYNTPEKIDETDKTGIVSHEDLYEEGAGGADLAGGVAGSETNSDVAEYNTDGADDLTGAYSESVSRDYLVNQIKEQGQISPGALEDLTVSVAVNGTGYGSLRENQLRSLIGNAAGIAADDQDEKITVVSAPFDGVEEETGEEEQQGFFAGVPLWYFLVAGALILLLIIIVIVLIMRRRRKNQEEEEELEEEQGLTPEELEALRAQSLNRELLEIQNDRGMELKRNIREFAEQNAEISAQLLKSWLNGGDGDGEH